jgi:hypothetical protein
MSKNNKNPSNKKKKPGPKSGKQRFVLDVKPFSVGPVESKGFHMASGRSAGPITIAKDKMIRGVYEPLSDINESVALEVNTFALQPGLASVFPRGSKEASAFQNYAVMRLRIHYVPDVSYFADGGQQGTVYLGFSPNPTASLPDGVLGLQMLPAHSNALASEKQTLSCDSVIDMSQFKIRQGIVPGGASVNDYDSGTFFVGVEGSLASAAKIGTVSTSFEFHAWHPVVGDSLQATLNTTCATLVSPGAAQTLATETLFQLAVLESGIGVTATAGVISPLPGHYQLTCSGEWQSTTSIYSKTLSLYRNGSLFKELVEVPAAASGNIFKESFLNFTWPITIVDDDVLELRSTISGTGTITGQGYIFMRTC